MGAKFKRCYFEDAVNICKSYDPFTDYIESYIQMKEAEEKNKRLDNMFNGLMLGIGVKTSGVPISCQNRGNETANALMVWFKDHDIELEEEKKKRVWTEEEIKSLIQTNDEVLYRALKRLYACQTADEKADKMTKEHNGVGFNGIDAEFLSSVSEFLIKRGFLTEKQKLYTRKKLVKYNKQLTRLANAS